MLTSEEVIVLIKEELRIKNLGQKLKNIIPLTQDMSLRRYFRIEFSENIFARKNTLLAMYFDSVACPEVGGGVSVNSDISFVELANFFHVHKIAVPLIFHQNLEKKLLFIEDLGNIHLADKLFEDNANSEELKKYFELAIEQIVLIQKTPVDMNFFPFKRSFNEVTYQNEMMEIVDFTLLGSDLSIAEIDTLKDFFRYHANELIKLPKVLAHRDFHAWNLIIEENKIRVIDFQDALIATRPYDLVSLLNDRDVDSYLGRDLYLELIKKFIAELKIDPSAFYQEYELVLLQRDLKVAGRLAKMDVLRGLTQYRKWIPGTLRRIGTNLARIVDRGLNKQYELALTILAKHLKEVEFGSRNSFKLK